MKTYKVVVNRCYGGYSVSNQAIRYLNKKYGMEYDEYEWGSVERLYLKSDIERHDPRLIDVVETLGKKASGDCAKLEIQEICSPIYRISEYDGLESVQTPGGMDWVSITEESLNIEHE